MLDFNRFINTTQIFLRKNSRTILTCGSVILTISAVCEAIRATSHAKDIIDEAEYEKFEYLGCHEDDVDDYRLTYSEILKNTWKCYIWTALLLSGAITCGIVSHIESNKKIEAATVAYGSLLETYNTYRDNVQKVVKERDNMLINHGVVHDMVERDKAVMPEYVKQQLFAVTDDTKVLFRDIYSSRTGKGYFKLTMEEVRRAEGRFNRMLMDNGSATLNDWYDCLDIGHSELGDVLGWRWENCGPLFAACVPDDINIVEDVAVVTGVGLVKDQYSKYFVMPDKLY
jgi:hypothetical protein